MELATISERANGLSWQRERLGVLQERLSESEALARKAREECDECAAQIAVLEAELKQAIRAWVASDVPVEVEPAAEVS